MRMVRDTNGKVIEVAAGRKSLPPRSATFTRCVKVSADHLHTTSNRERRARSQGIWAGSCSIAKIRAVPEGNIPRMLKQKV